MSTQIPTDVQKQIGEHLFAGQKIAAMKLYREYTHADLAAAKAAVEALEAELRAREPGRFTAPPAQSAKGCLLLVVVAALGVVVALAFLLLVRRPV